MIVRRQHHGFSLVELTMVVAIIAVVAMIAIPRMAGAVTNAASAAVLANARVLQNAVDNYAAEHSETTPDHEPDGSTAPDDLFVKRLVSATDEFGNTGTGIYGPYLLRIPINPGNKMATIRIDGEPAGANKAGWRYNSQTRRFHPDHLSDVVKPGDPDPDAGDAGGDNKPGAAPEDANTIK